MLLVSRYVTGFSLCYWFLVMLLVSRYVTGFWVMCICAVL